MGQTDPLISIEQAVLLGVDRLRLPRWANAMDHIKIDIVNGNLGPWVHLFCPMNRATNGDDPFDTPIGEFETRIPQWEPYRGPLPDTEEYKADAAGWLGRFDRWG